MRSRLNLTAMLAVIAACLLSLWLVPGAFAGNGNGNGSGSTNSSGPSSSAKICNGSSNSDTGNGANHSGVYNNTCASMPAGTPSGNGKGTGQATGKPCAGCVGNADDKNPKGQSQLGGNGDKNAGYECDRNQGIGQTNPAHTGCRTTTTVTPPPVNCPDPNATGCKPCEPNCTPSDKCTDPNGCDKCKGNCDRSECTNPNGCTTSTSKPTTTSTNGNSPASTPAQKVLGERTASPESTTSPTSSSSSPSASNALPASATAAHPASANKKGSLPFTGTDVLAVLLAAALALGCGLVLRRFIADRA